MTLWRMFVRGIQAVGLGAAFLVGFSVTPALAEDNAWNCLPSGDPNGAGSVTFRVLNYGIDGGEDDGGSAYEYEFGVNIQVHHHDLQRPDWIGPLACSIDGSWSQDLPIWDAYIGQFRPYQLNKGYIIANLPRDAKIRIVFSAVEQDDFTDDYADFDPAPNTWGAVEIEVFAEQGLAQTMVGKRNGSYDVALGQINRLQGDGSRSTGSDPFRAYLDYMIELNMDPMISPETLGILQGMAESQTFEMMQGFIDVDGTCRGYADRAVDLNNQASAYGCGFQFPVWSSDWAHHYNWCTNGDNWKGVGQHNMQRAADLQTCIAQKGQPGAANPFVCAIYAAEATNLATQAQAQGCGFTEWRWSTDYNEHYSWCMGITDPGFLIGETMARAAQLSLCMQK